MHSAVPAKAIVRVMAVLVAIIIIVIPFHALLTVWLSAAIGHYTALRLWKEALLAILAAGAAYLLATDSQLRERVRCARIVWLVVFYVALQLALGLAALVAHRVTLFALGYGWISDTRYLVFFVVVWIIAQRTRRLATMWPALVFWPAAAVVGFGLLQYFVLPYNFLAHLGYGMATIFPYEDINHNTHYIRIMSTLRGANPLGAYLVVSLVLLVAWLRRRQEVLWILILAFGMCVVLALTFSRSAWLGALTACAALAALRLRGRKAWLAAGAIAAVAVVALGVSAYVLRGDASFQNVVLHTEEGSAIPMTSNEGHVSALAGGLDDAAREPLGRGPGTAGPASVYNAGHPVRIAEDYYIQIAQEVGWLGLGLFLAINALVARELWQRREDTLAAGLLAGLVGVSLVCLLAHAWSDDTLAYLWWGLAAVACALPLDGSRAWL